MDNSNNKPNLNLCTLISGADVRMGIPLDEPIRFTPLADFVLIEPIPRGQTPGGIAIPEGADPEPGRGKVVKVGPGRTSEEGHLISPPVQPGDLVYLYFAYAEPIAITFGGKKYIIARCRDLMALAA